MALVREAMQRGMPLPAQVLAEYLNVARRKQVIPLDEARAFVIGVADACLVRPSETPDLIEASLLAQRHRLQYFDALILTVAARAGANTVYSEDMHNGLTLGPLTVVNPFRVAEHPV
jgi:predicted nucleic acid-binding protein